MTETQTLLNACVAGIQEKKGRNILLQSSSSLQKATLPLRWLPSQSLCATSHARRRTLSRRLWTAHAITCGWLLTTSTL